jgi:hypothetical protein
MDSKVQGRQGRQELELGGGFLERANALLEVGHLALEGGQPVVGQLVGVLLSGAYALDVGSQQVDGMRELLCHQSRLGIENLLAHNDRPHSSTIDWMAVCSWESRFCRIGQSAGSMEQYAQAFRSRRSLRMARIMSLDSVDIRRVSWHTGQCSQGEELSSIIVFSG